MSSVAVVRLARIELAASV